MSDEHGNATDDSSADAAPPAFESTLDARGLSCPMPVLKAKLELARLAPGQVLRVLATDPFSVADFAAFCSKTGHELLHSEETDDRVFVFHLRRHS